MTRLFLFGVSGRMGNMIIDCASQGNEAIVVGGFDKVASPKVPTFSSIDDIDCEFDVIVDFSLPVLLDEVIALAKKSGKGVVFATTGYTAEQEEKIKALSATVPVLRSGNMSLGVNLLLDLVEKATKALADGFDIEIIEKHHNQKVDAPSGTAKMLADSVKSVKTDAKYLYGREGASKREKEDVTIHAVRGGTIVGEHEVIFAGNDEIITLSHTALSRKIFANGAIRASIFLKDKANGYYTMKNALQ